MGAQKISVGLIGELLSMKPKNEESCEGQIEVYLLCQPLLVIKRDIF